MSETKDTQIKPVWRNIWLTKLKERRSVILPILSVLLVITILLLVLPHVLPMPSLVATSKGIGVSHDKDGEDIGLSDGSYALDVEKDKQDIEKYRPGSDYKTQASDAFRRGDASTATALWKEALRVDSNDAETKIYLEDQQVVTSGKPYVTIVLGSVLSNKPVDYPSRDQLQGAYIAQLEHNQSVRTAGGLLLRLLIAKSGNTPINSIAVANRIVEAAKSDKTIIGVFGWTKTTSSLDVLPILTRAHLPLLASTAPGDDLTGRSPYFFRVTPTNKEQASVLAKYAETKLKLQKLVAVYEEQDPFSQNFVDDFTQQFVTGGHQAPARLTYERLSTPEKMAQTVQSVLQMNADSVLLIGSRSTDIANFLRAIPDNSHMKILTNAGQYAIVNAPLGEYRNTQGLIFVSPGFLDSWTIIKPSVQAPSFFSAYKRQFDPNDLHKNAPYGYQRPDAYTMLAYDAVLTFLKGIQIASTTHKESMTGDDLQQALLKINGAQAVQGVTG
ncbi:MAG: hypothetical protein E6J34_00330, partial [Chloroflexi bacterium]